MYKQMKGDKMKRKILTLLLASTLALSIAACGDSDNTSSTKSNSSSAESDTSSTESNSSSAESDASSTESNSSSTKNDTSSADSTYQELLDEYTQKLEDAAPSLADEFNAEAKEKTGDIDSLAKISANKTEQLAVICTEGTEKMAELMTKNGDDYETYEEWAKKLNDIYMEQAQIITNAYMDFSTGSETK